MIWKEPDRRLDVEVRRDPILLKGGAVDAGFHPAHTNFLAPVAPKSASQANIGTPIGGGALDQACC